MTTLIYDRIGRGYTKNRCADPRIINSIVNLIGLEPSAVIADIGAGTGNYSLALANLGFQVHAVDPSTTMRSQASAHDGIKWYEGFAEQLPLLQNSVDAVICILAAHHFSSLPIAIEEMARVCKTGPILWFTFDPREADMPWISDYFPSIWANTYNIFPPLADVCSLFAKQANLSTEIIPWPVPYDLYDCFLAAGWRRPGMYLDPAVRDCISAFALADPEIVGKGLAYLNHDLNSGRWKSLYGKLLDCDTVDWGYRFLKAQ